MAKIKEFASARNARPQEVKVRLVADERMESLLYATDLVVRKESKVSVDVPVLRQRGIVK